MRKMVVLCGLLLVFASELRAAGLDVQLKDLRNSFYFVSDSKTCTKLVSAEIKKFGRLLHCNPEEDHVICPLKSGDKLFAYELKPACDEALAKREKTP